MKSHSHATDQNIMSLPVQPVMLDPTIPRCAPRLPIVPSTFSYAKPVLEIPEPSLIFDYHNLKNVQPVINSMKQNSGLQNIGSPNYDVTGNDSASQLLEIVVNLEKSMSLLQAQVDAITATQEAQGTKLDEILKLLQYSLIGQRSDEAAQTEKDGENRSDVVITNITPTKNTPVNLVQRTLPVSVPEEPKARHNSGSSAKSSSSSDTNPSSSDSNITSASKNPEATRRVTATKVTKPRVPTQVHEDSKESVSMAIRDLRLPTVQESIFSENSMHTIDLEEFDNSDSFEEEGDTSNDPGFDNPVQPTNTFYRKVIGNVRNNLLERANQEPSPAGYGSETTIYGMSSNNLSFATRQYLQKYGLTQGTKNNPSAGVQNAAVKPPERLNLTRQDRLLDLNALRNQPKFL